MGYGKNYYWPALDNAIRAAAYRGIKVDLLISRWRYSRPDMIAFLKSLMQINTGLHKGSISVKLFTVPSDKEQSKMDHTRVNHAKYMVTDKAAYIGTSNWSGDYFISTAGVGLIIEGVDSPMLVNRFNELFMRDWNSTYADPLLL
uniref:PLD phosphodiesterase domain-containing protein n=1 Tax=Ditylenchus dipsaci TaxID=166011 RepID=A0A915DRP0_9BILA